MGIIERISEADAVRDIGGILERVRTQGASIEIVRGEEVVARVTPGMGPAAGSCTIEQLIAVWKRLPRLEPDDSAAFEADLAAIRNEFPMQEREWE